MVFVSFIANKRYKGGGDDMDLHVLNHLKEYLAWAVDKRLQDFSTVNVIKNS